jgi:Ran GTPase-activating protein (RanGAP) involved in mRNA processing and transport
VLKRLVLRANAIGDTGAARLADALEASHLEVLDLQGNRIGPVGAQSLAAGLQVRRRHRPRCTRSDGGAARAQRSRTLVSLNLRGNSIDDMGAAAIAGALSSARLSELDLCANRCACRCVGRALRQD